MLPKTKDLTLTPERAKELSNIMEALQKGEHYESENCWCDPEIIVYENGDKVIIHNEEN